MYGGDQMSSCILETGEDRYVRDEYMPDAHEVSDGTCDNVISLNRVQETCANKTSFINLIIQLASLCVVTGTEEIVYNQRLTLTKKILV